MEVDIAYLNFKWMLVAIIDRSAPLAVVRVSEEVQGKLPLCEAHRIVLLTDDDGGISGRLAIVGFVLG